jgi:hypothetical protein
MSGPKWGQIKKGERIKMTNQRLSQSKLRGTATIALFLLVLALVACSAGAPEAPAPAREQPAGEVVAQEAASLEIEQEAETATAGAENTPAEETATDRVSQAANRPDVYNRLIIKNAEVEMLVEDTDTAINRSLGIVTEYSGYVVSNRTWFTNEEKHATLTIGVPVENFEEMLRRLKELAITVTNETASGKDVSDEFVDLESRLRNLEATAARIRQFLDQAEDVEESLRVNAQLTDIEAQIEQVKGRMAYLRDRAAFSTITLQISPQPPQRTPVPSPTPTPTPVPWSASNSFNNATGVTGRVARALFQVGVDLVIWVVVVILPFALPVFGLLWFGVRLVRKTSGGPAVGPPSS